MSNASSVFVTCISIMFVFNAMYIIITPNVVNNMLIGAFVGLLMTVIAIGVLSGIQIFGTGIGSESVKILFASGALLNILFKIEIAGFPIGLGITNNMLSVFYMNEFLGIGFLLASGLAIISLITGLIIIIGGS